MVLQSNETPVNSLYFLGYRLIRWIQRTQKETLFDIDELYDSFNNVLEKKISFTKFLLLIDWLYINNSATLHEDGRVSVDVFNKD